MFCRTSRYIGIFAKSCSYRPIINGSLRANSSFPEQDIDQFEDWLRLLKNNREWAAGMKEKNPGYFDRLSAAQVSVNN